MMLMIKPIQGIVLLFVLFAPPAFSQSVGNYATARTTGVAYSSISTTGNAINSWRNVGGGFQQDDNRSNFVDIGFDFWYNGTRYTQFSVSTNGFIDFSSSTDNGDATADDFGYVNSAFSASSATLATRPALAVLYDDLTAQGGVLPLGYSIRYLLSGTAPNRTLTIEWINMAVYGNTSPSLNFQAKLYENTGRIDYNYGIMNTGTFTFSYTLGINAANVGLIPTAAQLKNQTTANTNTFSNTPQNNLSALPAANSRISFTPPVPANPTGSLTFTAVTQTSMTLNFTNWASNEVGYVVYYSTDGVNYTFKQQTAANVTNTNVTGLLPGTTYYWKVYAVTEGALSNALSGTRATNAAGNKVSNNASANWNNPSHWLPVGVPTATDNVTIRNGHTVTVNTDMVCNNLTVGEGAGGILRIGNNGTARDMDVNGTITVMPGGNFSVNTSSNTTHNLNLKGNIVNNGTINFQSDANSLCMVNCLNDGNQNISGTGGTNNYYRFNLNMGTSVSNVLNVTSNNFTAPANFINFQNGTFRLASTNSITLNLFSAASSTFGPTCGFTLANPNATVTVSGDLDLQGSLGVEAGTFQVGSAANDILLSNGGDVTITGGALNITGRYVSSSINNLSKFVMSGGTLTVPTIGSTNSTTQACFDISSPGSVVVISGGTIVIPREGGSGAQNLGYLVKDVINSSVTGGILQIGSSASPSAQIIEIESDLPVGNLLVNSNNATAFLVQPLTVVNNVTIQSGTLNVNNLNLTLGGNWVDNANFTPGTGTVIFNGSSLQTITDPTGETFNNLTCNSTNTVRLLNTINLNGNMLVNASSTLDAGPGNQTINIRGNWTKHGTFNAREGLVNFNGTTAQQMAGSGSACRFFDLRTGNTAGVTITSGTYELEDAWTPAAGNFNVTGATSFTMLSNATRTSRIAPAAATASVTGNMIVQRFISARAAGYSDMASPVISTTFADWDNELLLVYGYSPPFLYPSAYTYSESSADYVAVTSAVQTIVSGQGFEVYLDSDGTYTVCNNTTLDSRGTPRLGNVNISGMLSFAYDGWNLVGNPYASFISLDNLIASSSGISSSIMIYDEVAGDFQVLTTGSGVQIAPHQGFWVNATSLSPSMIFAETHKTTTTNSTFRSDNTEFTLSLQYANKENFFTSRTHLVSDWSAVDEVTFKHLPHPLAPRLYSVNEDNQAFRLKKVDMDHDMVTVPLGFSVGEQAIYSIAALNLQKLYDQGFTCVYLHDKTTGNKVLMQEGNKPYRFSAGTGDEQGRFELILYKNTSCQPSLLNQQSQVHFALDGITAIATIETNGTAQSGTVQVFDLYGQAVSNVMPVNGDGIYRVQMPRVAACYLVKVMLGDQVFVHKYVVQQ